MFGKHTLCAAVVGVALIAAALPGYAATAPDLTRPKDGETVDVLVQYATPPSDSDHRRVGARHGHLKAKYDHVGMAHYSVGAEALADLEQNENVVSISPNRPVSAFLDHVDASVNVYQLCNYFMSISRGKGVGIGIAIIDSGINTAHPNFNSWGTSTSRVIYSESFVGGDALDHFGHGTHVAGIAAGTDNLTAKLGSNATRTFWGMVADPA